MFLILKCPYRTTLEHAEDLREHGGPLGLQSWHVLCPSQRIIKRVGRMRTRTELDIPIIGGFVFVQWNNDNDWVARLEREFRNIKAMHRCEGGFATCTVEEIMSIEPDPNAGELPEMDVHSLFPIGCDVTIKEGPFTGLFGTVQKHGANGSVRIKIKNAKMQISALQVPCAMLALSANC